MPITLKNVNHIYDEGLPTQRMALSDINLIFEDHCFTALIGETGSGKSTLIQHLNGLLLPTSGIVSVNDYVIDMTLEYKKKHGQETNVVDKRKMAKKHRKKLKEIKSLRKRVGLVFQFPEYQIFEETVIKDVSYGPKNFGATPDQALQSAKRALSLVGLDKSYYERSPFELSGGEKRRVAIAGIIALNPDVLVLDEPTVGLDAAGEEMLMNLLTDIYKNGTSIIIATHNMDVVLKYANRAIVLDQGKIIKDTTPLILFQNHDFIKQSSLLPPKVFSFALSLKSKGFNIDLARIKDTETLAKEIMRVKNEAQK